WASLGGLGEAGGRRRRRRLALDDPRPGTADRATAAAVLAGPWRAAVGGLGAPVRRPREAAEDAVGQQNGDEHEQAAKRKQPAGRQQAGGEGGLGKIDQHRP